MDNKNSVNDNPWTVNERQTFFYDRFNANNSQDVSLETLQCSYRNLDGTSNEILLVQEYYGFGEFGDLSAYRIPEGMRCSDVVEDLHDDTLESLEPNSRKFSLDHSLRKLTKFSLSSDDKEKILEGISRFDSASRAESRLALDSANATYKAKKDAEQRDMEQASPDNQTTAQKLESIRKEQSQQTNYSADKSITEMKSIKLESTDISSEEEPKQSGMRME